MEGKPQITGPVPERAASRVTNANSSDDQSDEAIISTHFGNRKGKKDNTKPKQSRAKTVVEKATKAVTKRAALPVPKPISQPVSNVVETAVIPLPSKKSNEKPEKDTIIAADFESHMLYMERAQLMSTKIVEHQRLMAKLQYEMEMDKVNFKVQRQIAKQAIEKLKK